jgi:DNA polymerase-3 subunit beta
MLKAMVTIQELQRGLSLTTNIAGKFSSMPILANVRLEASAGRLTLTATDLETTFQASYAADVMDEGSLTVPAKTLSSIASSLNGSTVILEELENLVLQVKTDYFVTDLLGLSSNEFPKTEDMGAITFTDFPSSDLVDSINKTIYSISVGNANFNLGGIYWVKEPLGEEHEVLKLVSTDNNRLNVATLATDNLEAFLLDTGVLVSRKGLQELKALAETTERISLGLNATNLVARTANSLLILRLLNGKFPNYHLLIPTEEGYGITLNRKEFTDTLKRMSLLVNEKFRVIYFFVNSDSMLLTSNNPELGQAEEKIPISYEGPPLKIGFDPKFILDAITTMKSEKIKISITSNKRPAVLTGENDRGYLGIITTVAPPED